MISLHCTETTFVPSRREILLIYWNLRTAILGHYFFFPVTPSLYHCRKPISLVSGLFFLCFFQKNKQVNVCVFISQFLLTKNSLLYILFCNFFFFTKQYILGITPYSFMKIFFISCISWFLRRKTRSSFWCLWSILSIVTL